MKTLHEQMGTAYRAMAKDARYRPAAPSDGFGNITAPAKNLDLDAEAAEYAAQWWKEEDELEFFVGCCNFPSRPATIFAIEAARLLCGGNDETALRLLWMAVADLEKRGESA